MGHVCGSFVSRYSGAASTRVRFGAMWTDCSTERIKRITWKVDSSYPRLGYGQIVDSIAQSLTPGRLEVGVSAHARIKTVGREIIRVDVKKHGENHTLFTSAAVNTSPITLFISMMDPQAPKRILEATEKLLFSNMMLVALFLLVQESISDAASIYFPDSSLEFTGPMNPGIAAVKSARREKLPWW